MVIAGALSSIVDSALQQKPRGFFADQFENQSNYWAHYEGTGPEILRQTGGNIDAFISGAGGFVFAAASEVQGREGPSLGLGNT